MKRSVTLTAVSLIVLVGLIAAFTVSEGATPRLPRPRPPEQPQVNPDILSEEPTSPQMPGVAKPTEPDPLADPNKVKAKVKSFAGLEKVLSDLERQSQSEAREWLQSTTDNRMNQVRAVERQMRAELDAIRRLAVEEKAVKTVAAIDGLTLNRLERSRRLIRKMEEDAKAVRQPRGTRLRGREMGFEGAAVPGQDVNQPGLRLRRR